MQIQNTFYLHLWKVYKLIKLQIFWFLIISYIMYSSIHYISDMVICSHSIMFVFPNSFVYFYLQNIIFSAGRNEIALPTSLF